MTDRFALDDVLKVARRVLETEAEAVRALVDRLDHRFERAVELIETCRGRVVVTGMGKSGLVGKKMAATLAATGTPALFPHPADGVHGDLGMLVRGDVAVVLSHSGETEEILALVPAIKRLAVPLVALTGRPASRLAQHACSLRQNRCRSGRASLEPSGSSRRYGGSVVPSVTGVS